MAIAITFTNNKGGVGKTTTAVNTALALVWLLRQGKAPNCKVLLVDTDSQAHATLVTTGLRDFGKEEGQYHPNKTLVGVLEAERDVAGSILNQNIIPSSWDADLHVLPAATADLDQTERNLHGKRGYIHLISNALQEVTNKYAFIIFDTRPSFSLLTEMALMASQHAIIVTESGYFETVGIMRVIENVYDIRDAWYHPNLNVSGLTVTKIDGRMNSDKELLADIAAHPTLSKIFMGAIPTSSRVRESHKAHMSIFDFDANSGAAQGYINLTKQIIQRLYVGIRS